VLCLWQMDTGVRQDLPHLMSPIESLTVSPRGISYAVRLADNSIMVLSTTELLPKANFPGIQSQFVPTTPSLLPQVITLASTTKESDDPLDAVGKTPAISNPRNPNQILLAVPSSQDVTESNSTHAPAPYLETYDVFSSRHVARQALARNTTTDRNMGPERNKIIDSNVTQVQITADGQWLATVDEWAPPAADVDYAVIAAGSIADEQRRRLEIRLKFWSWDSEMEQWVLEARVDSPHHSSTNPFCKGVFDLVVHPTSHSFATIGPDGIVRVWKPKKKTRDGIVTSIAWSAVRTIELEKELARAGPFQDFPAPPSPTNGKLAYSNDGSILAAAQESPDALDSGLVHFIDTATGKVKTSETSMYTTGLVDVGFLNRYFIILSTMDIRVWDVVTNKLVYGHAFLLPALTQQQKVLMAHLAVNVASNAFAIAMPTVDKQLRADNIVPELDELFSTVTVFEPVKAQPVWFDEVPLVTALVGSSGAAGFIVIDTGAEVRTIAPKSAAVYVAKAVSSNSATISNDEDENMEDIPAEKELDSENEESEEDSDEGDIPLEDDRAVVQPQQLAGVLGSGPSFGLPSVKDLFESVVGLFGGKRVSAS
jgi:NET1-associated nuclear protein 1 (U3 small nucleolar RNA-associated protein 17)